MPRSAWRPSQVRWTRATASALAVPCNGEATVTGSVERRSTAEIVAETIRLVPGIVDLKADLAWTLDDRDIKPATRSPEFPFGVQ